MSKISEIDEVSLKQMQEQTEKGVSSAEQMRRTQLNFYCELYSQLVKLNDNLLQLQRSYILSHSKDIGEYFRNSN